MPLCPKAQEILKTKKVNQSTIQIIENMEPWRQIGWLTNPLLQSIIDNVKLPDCPYTERNRGAPAV